MDFHSAFEELAFLLATRTLSDTTAPSDVPHTVQNIAQRGIARAARLYNARQTHARVSPALLSMISSRLPTDDRLSVARVCHRWREICMADGTLWADVNTSSPMSFIRWQVQQSGSSPLRITADLRDTRGAGPGGLALSELKARTDFVKLNMDRAQALSIHATSDVISRVLLRPASGLQRLQITGVTYRTPRSVEQGELSSDLLLGAVRWPVLRELSVLGISLPETALVRLLAMCPVLESLKCDLTRYGNTGLLECPIMTYVPRLRVASFTGMTHELSKVLPYLRAVRDVDIQYRPRIGSGYHRRSPLLLSDLITRDETDPVVDALVSEIEVRLRLERSTRTLHIPLTEDLDWLLRQHSVFNGLTSLVLFPNLSKKSLPPAPVLQTLILLHDSKALYNRATFHKWENCDSAWPTPALQTICFGWLAENLRDDEDLIGIDRRWLVTVLQNVFGFSADRRLPSLIFQNAMLEDGEVEGLVALEDLVENIDEVEDLEWDPWATIVSSAP